MPVRAFDGINQKTCVGVVITNVVATLAAPICLLKRNLVPAGNALHFFTHRQLLQSRCVQVLWRTHLSSTTFYVWCGVPVKWIAPTGQEIK
jgi:hypothetical protein